MDFFPLHYRDPPVRSATDGMSDTRTEFITGIEGFYFLGGFNFLKKRNNTRSGSPAVLEKMDYKTTTTTLGPQQYSKKWITKQQPDGETM